MREGFCDVEGAQTASISDFRMFVEVFEEVHKGKSMSTEFEDYVLSMYGGDDFNFFVLFIFNSVCRAHVIR